MAGTITWGLESYSGVYELCLDSSPGLPFLDRVSPSVGALLYEVLIKPEGVRWVKQQRFLVGVCR